jgi:hypothetical protein
LKKGLNPRHFLGKYTFIVSHFILGPNYFPLILSIDRPPPAAAAALDDQLLTVLPSSSPSGLPTQRGLDQQHQPAASAQIVVGTHSLAGVGLRGVSSSVDSESMMTPTTSYLTLPLLQRSPVSSILYDLLGLTSIDNMELHASMFSSCCSHVPTNIDIRSISLHAQVEVLVWMGSPTLLAVYLSQAYKDDRSTGG